MKVVANINILICARVSSNWNGIFRAVQYTAKRCRLKLVWSFACARNNHVWVTRSKREKKTHTHNNQSAICFFCFCCSIEWSLFGHLKQHMTNPVDLKNLHGIHGACLLLLDLCPPSFVPWFFFCLHLHSCRKYFDHELNLNFC